MRKVILRINIFIYLTIATFACSAEISIGAKYIDGITLTVTNKSFDAKAHKIQKCDMDYICSIDDRIYYGNGGKIPKQEVSSLVFSQNGKQIYLDVSAMYESGITNKNIKERIKVQSWGSGSYRVITYLGKPKILYIAQWLVWEGYSIRNHFSDYESLASLAFEVNKDFNIIQ